MNPSQKVHIPDEPSQKVNPMNPSQKVHIPDEP